MRRSTTIFLAVALGTTLLVGSAPAASAQPERYSARSYNAFWHTTRRVDADTYLKITWYAGVYEQADGFWSDLYRSTERCDRRPAATAAAREPFMVGVIEDLGRGSFTLGKNSSSARSTRPIPWSSTHPGVTNAEVGRIHIAVDLVGTGVLSTTREHVRVRRRLHTCAVLGTLGIPTGDRERNVLTFRRTGKTLRLHDTEEANMSQGESMSITHEC